MKMFGAPTCKEPNAAASYSRSSTDSDIMELINDGNAVKQNTVSPSNISSVSSNTSYLTCTENLELNSSPEIMQIGCDSSIQTIVDDVTTKYILKNYGKKFNVRKLDDCESCEENKDSISSLFDKKVSITEKSVSSEEKDASIQSQEKENGSTSTTQTNVASNQFLDNNVNISSSQELVEEIETSNQYSSNRVLDTSDDSIDIESIERNLIKIVGDDCYSVDTRFASQVVHFPCSQDESQSEGNISEPIPCMLTKSSLHSMSSKNSLNVSSRVCKRLKSNHSNIATFNSSNIKLPMSNCTVTNGASNFDNNSTPHIANNQENNPKLNKDSTTNINKKIEINLKNHSMEIVSHPISFDAKIPTKPITLSEIEHIELPVRIGEPISNHTVNSSDVITSTTQTIFKEPYNSNFSTNTTPGDNDSERTTEGPVNTLMKKHRGRKILSQAQINFRNKIRTKKMLSVFNRAGDIETNRSHNVKAVIEKKSHSNLIADRTVDDIVCISDSNPISNKKNESDHNYATWNKKAMHQTLPSHSIHKNKITSSHTNIKFTSLRNLTEYSNSSSDLPSRSQSSNPMPSVPSSQATQNPTVPNLQHSVPNLQHSVSSPQPSVSSLQPSVPNLQHSVSSPQPSVSSPQPSVSSLQPSVSSLQPSVPNLQHSVSSPQPTVSSLQPSVSSPQPSVSSLQPSVSSLQPSVSSLQPSVSSQQPSVSSQQPSVSSLQPSVSSLQPSVSSLQPSVSSLQPSVSSQQPSVSSQQPSVSSQQPSVSSQQPSVSSQQPSVSSQQPSVSSQQPSVSSLQPSVSSPQPSVSSPQPSVSSLQPSVSSQQPSVSSQQPSVSSQQPSVSSQQPSVSSQQPSVSSQQPSVSSHQPSVSIPQPSVSIPQPSVSIPQPSVSIPQPSVSIPQPSVSIPQPSVSIPQPSVSIPQPSVSIPQPSVSIPKPSVSIPKTSVSNTKSSVSNTKSSVSIPKTSVSIPKSSVSNTKSSVSSLQPSVSSPQPSVSSPQPSVSTPQPSVSTPQPSVSTPQPSVSTPQPSVSTLQPSVSTLQPSVSTLQPSVSISQPSVSISQPFVSIFQPFVSNTQPSVSNTQPSVSNTQPSVSTPQPSVSISQPFSNTQPFVSISQPSVSNTQPSVSNTQPSVSNPQPSVSNPQPSVSNPQPSVSNTQPSVSNPQPSVSNPQPSVSNPQPSVSNPQPSVSNPKPSVSNPQPSVSNPQPSVSNPQPSVSNPQPSVSNTQPSVSNTQPSFSNPLPSFSNPQPSDFNERSVLQNGFSRSEPPQDNSGMLPNNNVLPAPSKTNSAHPKGTIVENADESIGSETESLLESQTHYLNNDVDNFTHRYDRTYNPHSNNCASGRAVRQVVNKRNIRIGVNENFRNKLYSYAEDLQILHCIHSLCGYQHTNGNKIWVEMTNTMKNRTWMSLKNRFLRNILPKINEFAASGGQTGVIANRIRNETSAPRDSTVGSTWSQGGRKSYSRSEDLAIINYILKNDGAEMVNGVVLWQQLEQNKHPELTDRTWQSLKERYRKKIKPDLKGYNLPPEDVQTLSGNANSQKSKGSGGPVAKKKERRVPQNNNKIIAEVVSKQTKSKRRYSNHEHPYVIDSSSSDEEVVTLPQMRKTRRLNRRETLSISQPTLDDNISSNNKRLKGISSSNPQKTISKESSRHDAHIKNAKREIVDNVNPENSNLLGSNVATLDKSVSSDFSGDEHSVTLKIVENTESGIKKPIGKRVSEILRNICSKHADDNLKAVNVLDDDCLTLTIRKKSRNSTKNVPNEKLTKKDGSEGKEKTDEGNPNADKRELNADEGELNVDEEKLKKNVETTKNNDSKKMTSRSNRKVSENVENGCSTISSPVVSPSKVSSSEKRRRDSLERTKQSKRIKRSSNSITDFNMTNADISPIKKIPDQILDVSIEADSQPSARRRSERRESRNKSKGMTSGESKEKSRCENTTEISKGERSRSDSKSNGSMQESSKSDVNQRPTRKSPRKSNERNRSRSKFLASDRTSSTEGSVIVKSSSSSQCCSSESNSDYIHRFSSRLKLRGGGLNGRRTERENKPRGSKRRARDSSVSSVELRENEFEITCTPFSSSRINTPNSVQ